MSTVPYREEAYWTQYTTLLEGGHFKLSCVTLTACVNISLVTHTLNVKDYLKVIRYSY